MIKAIKYIYKISPVVLNVMFEAIFWGRKTRFCEDEHLTQ
jgi:hypothetical protein